MELNKNLIETIASQWKRLNIETAEDAMNHALKESKRKKTKEVKVVKTKESIIPSWFSKDNSDTELTQNEITKSEEDEMKDLLRGVYEDNK